MSRYTSVCFLPLDFVALFVWGALVALHAWRWCSELLDEAILRGDLVIHTYLPTRWLFNYRQILGIHQYICSKCLVVLYSILCDILAPLSGRILVASHCVMTLGCAPINHIFSHLTHGPLHMDVLVLGTRRQQRLTDSNSV